MDERFTLLSAIKDGDLTEVQTLKHLSCSPHWVGMAT
jgi:hypothetical protein